MIHLSPSDVEEMAGVSPDILRDWRRRGLLNGIGHIVLPDGSVTSDVARAHAAGVGRATWLYAIGDIVRLVIARNIGSLTIEIATQLWIADAAAPFIVAFATQSSITPALTDRRFLVAWRNAAGDFEAVRFDDLNNITSHDATLAVVIDLHREAARLPAKLVHLLASKFGPDAEGRA